MIDDYDQHHRHHHRRRHPHSHHHHHPHHHHHHRHHYHHHKHHHHHHHRHLRHHHAASTCGARLSLQLTNVESTTDSLCMNPQKPPSMHCIACATLKEAPQPHFSGSFGGSSGRWQHGTLPCVKQSRGESILA